MNTGKETVDICNFPSSLETRYIVDMFWLKYKQIFGRLRRWSLGILSFIELILEK